MHLIIFLGQLIFQMTWVVNEIIVNCAEWSVSFVDLNECVEVPKEPRVKEKGGNNRPRKIDYTDARPPRRISPGRHQRVPWRGLAAETSG